MQDILAHQLEDEIKLKYERAAQVEKQLLKEREDAFRQSLEDFEEKKKRENELFQERLDKQLKEKQAESELKIRARLQEEQSEQFKLMQQELN